MQNKDNYLIVIGPNAAYQKTLTFDHFKVDQVNRASNIRVYTGGKGTNFCRALKSYTHNLAHLYPILFTFLGGANGKKIWENLKKEEIELRYTEVDTETRTCVTCLDSNTQTMTEIIEPSKPISAEAMMEMEEMIMSYLPSAKGVAIMGSLPDNSDPVMYKRWMEMAAKAKKPILIDAVQKGITECLRCDNECTILKINREELIKITNENHYDRAVQYAFKEFNISILAITNGPHKAHLYVKNKEFANLTEVETLLCYEYEVPKIESVVSPLGAGDTVAAVFFSEFVSGTAPVDAFKKGLAAASATCLHEEAGKFTMNEVNKIVDEIKVCTETCEVYNKKEELLVP